MDKAVKFLKRYIPLEFVPVNLFHRNKNNST